MESGTEDPVQASASGRRALVRRRVPRKSGEERNLNQHMALIVAASADAIISSDLEGCIVSWNPAAEKIFGYTPSEMIGQTSERITPPAFHEEMRRLKARVRRGEQVENLETVRVSRTGELIEVGLSIFPLRNSRGAIIGTSAIVRDIREQKKTVRRLHQLSSRLLRLQDEERRRLARDLHDSTAQSLAALAMNLSLLNSDAEFSEEERKRLLADGLAMAKNIECELRTHSYLLHPPLLDERGLSAALRWLVEGFASRSGLVVHLAIDPEIVRLPERVELTLFRAAQESLSNVHRHSKSTTVSIRLRKGQGAIELEVRDKGRGFSQENVACNGVGINGMRERLAQINGTLAIQSDHQGTVVTVRVPSK